ncbi:MAG: VWA domain-containing protein, partial [Myxococcota bacterium]
MSTSPKTRPQKWWIPYARVFMPVAWALGCLLMGSFVVAAALEIHYEVDFSADVFRATLWPFEERDGAGFRYERPFAFLLLPGVVLVWIARGWLHKLYAPRILVSRGKTLATGRRGLRSWFADLPLGLRVAALFLLTLALAGPQSVHARNRTALQGIDIVLALDLSLSMQAADIEPTRFQATKQVVDHFIRNRPNDRIGAVVFGRDAYTLLPLTTDKETLRHTISELNLELIDGRGTAIGNAVATSLNRLRKSEAKSKLVILMTDGESNSGNVSPDQAAEFAATMDVKVFTILMGATDDTRVQRGTDIFGQAIFDTGNFPVNPELLQRMADVTGGHYFSVTDRRGLERSFHTILNELEKSEIEDLGVYYGELFPAFL